MTLKKESPSKFRTIEATAPLKHKQEMKVQQMQRQFAALDGCPAGSMASAGLLGWLRPTDTVVELTAVGCRAEGGPQRMKCVPCVSGAHGPAGQGCSLRARLAHLTLLSPSTRVEEAAEEPPCIACTAELHALRLWDIAASSRGPRAAISNLSTRCMCALRAVRETARRNKNVNPVVC